jgi:class 3 adenylate cyclase
MGETRKIAAILVADVVGYSRLTGIDEEATLARLRNLRAELFNPTVEAHDGRVVKRTGDGVILEFRSVVEAVRCALDVITGLAERNADLPQGQRIEVRTGIHLGDVVEEPDGDLLGDGVNIAARLEGICQPGGILLSEDAWRQVRDRLQETFIDLGEKELKNIVRPMRVYGLGEAFAAPCAASTPIDPPPQTTPGVRAIPAAVVGILESVARLTDAYADRAATYDRRRVRPFRDRKRRGPEAVVGILEKIDRIVSAEADRAAALRDWGLRRQGALNPPAPKVAQEADPSVPPAPSRLRPDRKPRTRLRLPIIATAILLVLATRACHGPEFKPPPPPAPPAMGITR